jgi:hypothetical protein
MKLKLCILLTQCIYVFRMILTIHINYNYLNTLVNCCLHWTLTVFSVRYELKFICNLDAAYIVFGRLIYSFIG